MSRRYLLAWFISAVITTLLVIGFNALVDPYGLIGSPRIDGLTAKKPAAQTRSRIVKPYIADRTHPRVLIVGNSRPEAGLDPSHPCLQSFGPTYSLTLPGASFYQQVRTLQHALTITDPALVLLAVDFLDFLVDPNTTQDPHAWPPQTREFEKHLAVDALGNPNGAYKLQKFADYRDALLSLTAFKDSIMTLAAQHWPLARTITAQGFNPANEYMDIILSEGQHVLFEQKNAELAEQLGRQEWSIFTPHTQWSPAFEALDRAIGMIQAKGAKVVVFINPYHVQYLDRIREAGYSQLLSQWKQALAALISQKDGVALWDFAMVDRYTTETPPPKGDRRNMLSWFLEPAHYRKELGDLVLRTMLAGTSCTLDAQMPAAGVRLQ